jgi:DNA-binding transcriptional MocR family regulator
VAAVRALAQHVSPLLCEILGALTRAGIADEVRAGIRQESAHRTALASALVGADLRSGSGHHAFIPLPQAVAEAVVLSATSRGIGLPDPTGMKADPSSPPRGIRVCLGAACIDDLTRALTLLRDLLGRACRRPAVLPA